MQTLEKQVVLVTGCSTGIGRALAKELQARGHSPVATARNPTALAELRDAGIDILPLDVNDGVSIERAVAATLEKKGRIDVLINNAGVNTFGPVLEQPLEQVRQVLETNVLGLLAVCQAVFPSMAERRSGRFLNVGSVVGLLPTPFAAAYCASKSAVHQLSEVLRMELMPFGIDVVVVQPGGVRSSIADSSSRGIERYSQAPSRYRAFYEGIRKRAYASQDRPMEAEDFARGLIEQAFAIPAPRIVRLGTGADFLPKLAEMPGRERDALLTAQYGLAEPDLSGRSGG